MSSASATSCGSCSAHAPLARTSSVTCSSIAGAPRQVRPHPAARQGVFLDALSAGERGGKHRVVFSDVTGVSSENVLSEIEEAHHRLPVTA